MILNDKTHYNFLQLEFHVFNHQVGFPKKTIPFR